MTVAFPRCCPVPRASRRDRAPARALACALAVAFTLPLAACGGTEAAPDLADGPGQAQDRGGRDGQTDAGPPDADPADSGDTGDLTGDGTDAVDGAVDADTVAPC